MNPTCSAVLSSPPLEGLLFGFDRFALSTRHRVGVRR